MDSGEFVARQITDDGSAIYRDVLSDEAWGWMREYGARGVYIREVDERFINLIRNAVSLYTKKEKEEASLSSL